MPANGSDAVEELFPSSRAPQATAPLADQDADQLSLLNLSATNVSMIIWVR